MDSAVQGGAVVYDQYVCGMSHVEVLSGGVSRYVFYTEEQAPDGGRVCAIALKLVMPNDALPDAVMKACTAASLAIMGNVWKPLH